MNNQRFEDCKRAYYDHHERKMTYDQIAEANGWGRGKVAGLLRDYAAQMPVNGATGGKREVLPRFSVDDPLDAIRSELRQANALIADLRNQINEQEDEALYGHNL